MYLPDTHSLNTTTSWGWEQQLEGYIRNILEFLQQLLVGSLGNLNNALGPPLHWIHRALTQLPEWIVKVFYVMVELVHTHKYWAHIIAWSIFFGPIALLVPFLLVHEILILFTYNLTFILHGFIPHSLPDHYEALRLSLLDARESLFSFVDRSSNVFNKWTAEHMPLMVLRLTGGALGSILLYAIWVGW